MDAVLANAVLNSLPSGICAVDREGNVAHANAALQRLLGWEMDRLRGRPLSDSLGAAIVDRGHALSWLVALNQALTSSATTYLNLPTDFITELEDRHPATLVGVAAPWTGQAGEPLGAVLVFSDSALYRDVEGVRARFLAAIAHELGGPVSNVVAAAAQMARHGDDLSPPVQQLLGIAQIELARLQRLMGAFLGPRPIQPPSPALRQDIVALPALIRRTIQVYGLRDTGRQLVAQIPPDLPFAWGDADGIQQVLGNLVDNALQYSPPGSQVAVRAEARPGEVLVLVIDQGPGLPIEEGKLWLVPRRDRPDGSPDSRGHGMGLLIATYLLQTMGGSLWYERRPAGESCFCFALTRVKDIADGERP